MNVVIFKQGQICQIVGQNSLHRAIVFLVVKNENWNAHDKRNFNVSEKVT